MTSSRRVRCSAVLVLVLVGGCVESTAQLRQKMESFDPARRIDAVVAAADSRATVLIPAIVDRLDDEDAGVRFYAILALDRLTGRRLGYDYAAPVGTRRQAVNAWRRFVARMPGAQAPRIARGDPGQNADTDAVAADPNGS